ncbi:MAG: aminopeptidase, partial [Vicinamibacterales bacterium]
MFSTKGRAAAWLLLAGAAACGAPPSEAPPPASATSHAAGVAAVAAVRDTHSYARPEEARVTHVALDLAADFRARVLNGTATLTIERAPGATSVVLDSKDLEVSAVRTTDGRPLDVSKGPVDPI